MDMICPLCHRGMREPPQIANGPRMIAFFDCETCGRFRADLTILSELKDGRWARYLHLISATTKEAKKPIQLDEDLLRQLEQGAIRERTVAEKIELMVRWYASRSVEVGQGFPFTPDADYPAAWCRSPREWSTLFSEVKELKYLKVDNREVSVSVSGWKYLGDLPQSTGAVAFVAMSFAEELSPVYEAIDAGIRAAGYDAVRVDEDHYTGAVMDRVLARIRESRFVVAEFAGNRGGVYYEAGFALGLGIPVICMCSRTQIEAESREERLHFDVRHLNFLPWERTELATLTGQLRERILALFGRGPL